MDIKSRSRTTINTTAIMALICTVLLTVCFFVSFDEELGYFDSGVLLPYLFKAFYIITVLSVLISSFIYTKERTFSVKEAPLPSPMKLIWLCVGALAAAFAIYETVLAIITNAASAYSISSSLGAISFGAYIIFTSLCKEQSYKPSRLLFLCLSALLPIGVSMENFFNVYRPSNSVENTLSACVSVAFLLYILYEAKRMVYGETSRFYLPSLLLAFFSGVTLSVSYLIAYTAGALNEVARFKDMLLLLLVCVYFACLIFRFISSEIQPITPEETAEQKQE